MELRTGCTPRTLLTFALGSVQVQGLPVSAASDLRWPIHSVSLMPASPKLSFPAAWKGSYTSWVLSLPPCRPLSPSLFSTREPAGPPSSLPSETLITQTRCAQQFRGI